MEAIIETRKIFESFLKEPNGPANLRSHLRNYLYGEHFDAENPNEILIQQFKNHLQTNGLENDFLGRFPKIISVILELFISEFRKNGDSKFIEGYLWFLSLFTYVAIKQMKIPEFSEFERVLAKKLGENPDFRQVMFFIISSPSNKLL